MDSKGIMVAEAARVLSVHPETVRRWERRGLIKARRNYRRFRVFDLQDVLRMKERREELTSENSQ